MSMVKYLFLIFSITLSAYASNSITLDFTKEEKEFLKNNPVIKMCANPIWAPIGFYNKETKQPEGISIDTMRLIEQKLGENVRFKYVYASTWKESQKLLKEKKCDFISLFKKNEKRAKYALFTKPYMNFKFAIITRNDRPLVTEFEDIIDKSIARKKGSGMIYALKKEYPDIQIVETKDFLDSLQKVSRGEVYAAIGTLPVLSYNANRFGIYNVQIAGYTDMNTSLSIGVRNDNPTLHSILDKGLAAISQEEHKKIQDKWMSVHIKELKSNNIIYIILSIILFIAVVYYFYKNYQSKKSLKELNIVLEEKAKELIIKNEQLEKAQEISKMGSWTLDLTNNKLEWSKEIFKIFEIEQNLFEASYDGFLDSIHPEDRDMVDKAYKDSIENKTPYSMKHRLLMDDGRVKWVREECETSFDKNGTPLLSTGTVQDITKDIATEEKIKEQEKIIQMQSKVAAIGEMLGNIAHQWRQPLSVITTSASGMLADIALGERLKEKDIELYANNIIKQSDYLSKTIDDFRNFFSADTKNIKEHNIKILFSHIQELVESSLKNNFIQCIHNIEDGVIKTNDTLLIQALINICNNAKDAIIENVHDTELRYLFVDVKIVDESLIITFRDNGGGISDNIIDKVFDPYFTTKHQSIGTGIGLYMTYQIITKQLNGAITVSNEEFEYNGKELKGAKFIVTLPLMLNK